jgi:hypothetical protein
MLMKNLRLVLSLGAGLLGTWIPMFAHHSFQAEYDDQKPITLTGKVTKVSPDNPHGWIYLDVKNDKGSHQLGLRTTPAERSSTQWLQHLRVQSYGGRP